ncbi:hypothetical protein FWH13_02800 [Candidatus Saccharibacteria bacterium]|nr:hypothetical protein [Candidatus Saccharibacteria bacterium]
MEPDIFDDYESDSKLESFEYGFGRQSMGSNIDFHIQVRKENGSFFHGNKETRKGKKLDDRNEYSRWTDVIASKRLSNEELAGIIEWADSNILLLREWDERYSGRDRTKPSLAGKLKITYDGLDFEANLNVSEQSLSEADREVLRSFDTLTDGLFNDLGDAAEV